MAALPSDTTKVNLDSDSDSPRLARAELAVFSDAINAIIANLTGLFGANGAAGTSVDIDGGTLDGVTIGASSAAPATVTTFTSTGIDDNATSTAITIDSSQNAAFTGNVVLPDNSKAIFGTGSDFKIFHDGANSYLEELGTGALVIRSNIISFRNAADTEYMVFFNEDSAVLLYHDGDKKFETTSTGVAVTGLITGGSLTLASGATVTAILDEDDMASNSATKLPTQQSVKAYVDASGGGGGSTLTDEQVEDIVGAMLTGNTETGVAVTYQDSDGTIDFAVSADTAQLVDDAVTAAKLANSINTDIATGVTASTTASAALPKAGGAMTGAITTNSTFDGVDIATRDGVLTSTTATAAAALPKAGGAMTGAITTNSTFDGVDVATRDGVLTSTTATASAALPKAGGAMTGAITTNSTFDGVDVAVRDAVLTSTTTTAGAALPKAGGAMTGAITTNSTFDGRDVATDGTKLDTIESSAKGDQSASEIKTLLEDGIDLVHMSSESVDEDNLHISNSPTDGYMLTAQSGNAGGLTWAASGGGGGGGGVWTEISSTTVSTAVSLVEFSVTGYTLYKLFYYGVNWGTNDNSFAIKITVGSGGTYSETMRFIMHRFGGGSSVDQHSVYGGTGSILELWSGTRVDSSNGSNFGEITIFNTVGQPTLKVDDCLMDDSSSLSAGITHAIAGFSSPSSSSTIGKIKLVGSQGDNIEAGTFALYGLTIS